MEELFGEVLYFQFHFNANLAITFASKVHFYFWLLSQRIKIKYW